MISRLFPHIRKILFRSSQVSRVPNIHGDIFSSLKPMELPSKENLTTNLNRFLYYEENPEARRIGRNLYNSLQTRYDLRKKNDRQKVVNKLYELATIDDCEHCGDIVDKFDNEIIQNTWGDTEIEFGKKPTKQLIVDILHPFKDHCDPIIQETVTTFCDEIETLDFRKKSAKEHVKNRLEKLTEIQTCDAQEDLFISVHKLEDLFCI